jgi:NADP-dependent 3-hydroxy acid dehydrogenase YdfG
MNAHQRTAIITGASSGIGLAVAEIFVREGINVVLNGRTEDKLVRATSQINQPDRATIITADITLPGTAKQIVNKAVKRFGQVDILVNNAGIFYSKPFIAYTIEELDTFLGYLRGTFVLTQAVVRQIQKQGQRRRQRQRHTQTQRQRQRQRHRHGHMRIQRKRQRLRQIGNIDEI